jgi:ATP adenylyltransferase
MSHVYQPLMIRELLTVGGKASTRQIAADILARDESQIEYYEASSRTWSAGS